MLDAYAVRKAIPRIVIAVIAINLSIYFCVAAVDIVNVISNGLTRLLVAPFNTAGLTVFEVETDPANAIIGSAGIAVGGSALYAAIGGLSLTGSAGLILGAITSLAWLLVPIGLLALAIVCTVVIRQALLFFLIVVSPVAIAAYILPGTEKYFQKWLDLFIKTLMVYPIIAVMFALSDVFASIIMSTNTGGLTGVAKIVTGIVVIYAPLFLIPFAFKFAGGAMAQIAGAAAGIGDRMGKSGFVKARREHYNDQLGEAVLRRRAEAYRNNKSIADRGGFRGRAAGYRARKLSGYKSDILDREAALNEKTAKEQAAVTNNGDDALFRAYTVNKDYADQERRAGRGKDNLWKQNDDGSISYRTAGGAWASSFDVDEAQRKFGKRNTSQLQQSLAYEMKKASTQEEQDRIVESFGRTAKDWGMSDNQANGAWIGAGFANQDTNLQWKHARWEKQGDGSFGMKANASGIIKEIDEKKGSWEAGRYNADTWTSMTREVEDAHQILNNGVSSQKEKDKAKETIQRATRIASSLSSGGGRYRDPDTGQIVENAVGQGASGRTAEEMKAFSRVALDRGAQHGFAQRDAATGQITVPDNYGTSTTRTDTGVETPRTDNEFQSNNDRKRPTAGQDSNPSDYV